MKTITAISTPHGVGAVSMIRLSGDDAVSVAEKVFCPVSGRLSEKQSRLSVYGKFRDERGFFDDGLAVIYRAPASYTGEDTVELMCHGGVLSTRRLLAATVSAGASPAAAGEYTKRAFINGKLSLSQAEAVGALIDAKTDACLDIGLRQLGGALSEKINGLCDRLLFLAASVYAYIDYPDEDMTDVSVEEMRAVLQEILAETERLGDSYRFGKAVSEGVKCSIVGCPNTGKSSVLNMLAGCDRAIVTSEAGTTRDVITESVRLGELLLLLSDTAGIRDGGGVIERMGIERSIESLREAELVLAVFDGSKPQDEGDFDIIRRIEESGKLAVTVGIVNKTDLGAVCEYKLPFPHIEISAKTGNGKERLEEAVLALYGAGIERNMGETVINARQHGALCKAAASLKNAIAALDGFTQDVAGFDIEEAIAAFAELDGRSVGEEIVDEIFSHFCVGK